MRVICDCLHVYRSNVIESLRKQIAALKEGPHWRSGQPSERLVFLTAVLTAVRTTVRTAARTVVKNTNCLDGRPDRQCDPSLRERVRLSLYAVQISQSKQT